MKEELTIRIAGEAGQGMQSIGLLLARLFCRAGRHVFANQDYMSRIRGGNNYFQLRVGPRPLAAPRGVCDLLVALDRDSVARHRGDLAAGGLIIGDPADGAGGRRAKNELAIPMKQLAEDAGGPLYANTVACGALAALTGLSPARVETALAGAFANKGPEVVARNRRAARAGYRAARGACPEPLFTPAGPRSRARLLLNGNEAIGLGALQAGCRFYTAYPMTPATSIMNLLAHYAGRYGVVIEQAEDELAAVNMAIGAAYAGVRAMTGTSGGGFALMGEGISLAAMTETPLVVVNAQRPGPATGFPTRTEQADLDFLIHAGHGEFARAVFAPGSIEECFALTVQAFNLAEAFQLPVLLMTDQFLADSYRNVRAPERRRARVRRPKTGSRTLTAGAYQRYRLTASGVSPRALPGIDGPAVYADSDEHGPAGHITEDAAMRVRMVDKRLRRKRAGLERQLVPPVTAGAENAPLLLVGFGSTRGVIREAVARLGEDRVAGVHLPQVWPFPAAALLPRLAAARKVLTVENNAGAQLAGLLRRETGFRVAGSILKYDGRPFDSDGLVRELEKEL